MHTGTMNRAKGSASAPSGAGSAGRRARPRTRHSAATSTAISSSVAQARKFSRTAVTLLLTPLAATVPATSGP